MADDARVKDKLAEGDADAADRRLADAKAWDCHRLSFFGFTLFFEIAIIILYSQCVTYSPEATTAHNGSDPAHVADAAELGAFYPMFQDVNVMIFVGFGFLMTFLRRYGYSAVGYTLVVAALAIQVHVLFGGLWERVWEDSPVGSHPGHGFDHKLEINIVTMIKALFASAAVLVSFGACLGKTTPTQLMVMAVLEVFFFAINEMLAVNFFRAVDMGGSMVVHAFGAYFGLAVSRTISKADVDVVRASNRGDDAPHDHGVPANEPTKVVRDHPLDGSTRTSDLFAMVGTLFLWLFWPSFNGALAPGDQQQRVAINTFLSLAACACSAFMADNLMRPHHRFDMVSIQNAALAGGVAVGSCADLVIQPWGALLVGFIAGIVSVAGYVFVGPFLAKCAGIHDTCGVNNLHGMPGIIGGVAGAVAASLANAGDDYVSDEKIQSIFPARAPCDLDFESPTFNPSPCGLTASEQAAQQILTLVVTLVMAIATGTLVGLVLKLPCLLPPGHTCAEAYACGGGLKKELWFEDSHYWAVPSDEEEDEGEEQQHDEEHGATVEGAGEEKYGGVEGGKGGTQIEMPEVVTGS